MNIETIIIDAMTVLLVGYAWRVLPAGRIRWLFIGAVLLLAFYKMYDPASEWRGMLWMRHLCVYGGEVCFYLFVTAFIARYIEIEDVKRPAVTSLRKNDLAAVIPFISFGTGVSWY